MGTGLPKPVTSVVQKRFSGASFQVGFAEMNGHRPNMEDAHVVVLRDTWGFFGVFDGHGGRDCSEFIAKRLTEELEGEAGGDKELGNRPEDDEAVKALMLRLDREFLETGKASGTTGTFAIVEKPSEADGRYLLRVGNIGDSRVLLGRADGTIVEGPGTDFGLTTDHKPNHPDERARIDRTGGTVEFPSGVARVNGDLAVSRAFGDAQYKQTGGPAQEDHPVTADPELLRLECDPTDFLLLVCDGISEAGFPNREVVCTAVEWLRRVADPAKAARAIVSKALSSGSKDNLSCMIVLFGGGELPGAKRELWPGPCSSPGNEAFRTAYGSMAEHAGLSLPEAVEMRYDIVRRELDTIESDGDTERQELSPSAEMTASALRQELEAFGEGPPAMMVAASIERVQWFSDWLEEKNQSGGDTDPSTEYGTTPLGILRALAGAYQPTSEQSIEIRKVRVASVEKLRPAIQQHQALTWNEDAHSKLCGQVASVIEDDQTDGTSKVQVGSPPVRVEAWLPADMLTPIDAEEEGGADSEELEPLPPITAEEGQDDRLTELD